MFSGSVGREGLVQADSATKTHGVCSYCSLFFKSNLRNYRGLVVLVIKSKCVFSHTIGRFPMKRWTVFCQDTGHLQIPTLCIHNTRRNM